MSPRQKYLVYQAYHEYKNERVFPMDLAVSLWDEGMDPSELEDLFDEGLTPNDLTGGDENDESSAYRSEEEQETASEFTWEDEDSEDDELRSLSGYLGELLAAFGEEEIEGFGMGITFIDGSIYSFSSLTTDVVTDIKAIENKIKIKPRG